MSLHIRIANNDDVTELSILGKKTFDQSFGHLFRDRKDVVDYLEKTFSVEKLQSSIVKSDNIFWIVHQEEIPIGYAKIQLNTPSEFINSTKVCKLHKIYFLKEYLSKGLGAQLQELIFEKVKEAKSEYIWLSVLKSNERAVTFYQKTGFQVIGEHPFSIGKEDFQFWVMGKKL